MKSDASKRDALEPYGQSMPAVPNIPTARHGGRYPRWPTAIMMVLPSRLRSGLLGRPLSGLQQIESKRKLVSSDKLGSPSLPEPC